MLEVTYTLTYKELMRHFVPPMPLRECLPLLLSLASPLLVYVIAYVSGSRQVTLFDLVAGLYGIACLLTIILWVLKVYIGRTSKSTTHLLEISEIDFLEKASDNSGHRYP